MGTTVTKSWIIAIGVVLTSMAWSASMVSQTDIIRYMVWTSVVLVVFASMKIDLKILSKGLFIALGYYILISILSYLRAMNFGEWFFDLSKVVLFGLTVYCVHMYLDRSVMNRVFIITTIVVGVYGLWQIGIDKLEKNMIANMPSRHMFSLYLLLMTPFCLSAKGSWKKLGYAATTLAILNIGFLRTRTALLSLLCSILITAIIFYRKALIYALVLMILFGVYIYTDRTVLDTGSMQSRLCIWKQTMLMIKDNLFVGGGNWKIAILPYSAGFLEKYAGFLRFCTEPHNEYIQVLAEKSIFGLIAYLSMFVFALYYAVKGKKPYLFMGLIIYMVFVFFDNKKSPTPLFILAIYFGLAIKSVYRPCFVRIRRAGLLVPVIVMIMFTFYLRFNTDICMLRSKTDKTVKLAITPFATVDRCTTPYILSMCHDYKRKGDMDNALKYVAEAYRYNKYNSYVILSYAELLVGKGETEKAVKQYQRALAICPDNIVAQINLKRINENKIY